MRERKIGFFCFIIARVEKEREKKKERVGCSFSFFYPLNVTFEMFFSAFLKGGRGEREGESERGGGVGGERAFFLVFGVCDFFLLFTNKIKPWWKTSRSSHNILFSKRAAKPRKIRGLRWGRKRSVRKRERERERERKKTFS